MCSKAVECPNSNLILNTHSKVLYQIMASCMDEEGLFKRTHSKSLGKLDKAGLNLKQKLLEASLPSVYMYRPRMANH